MPFSALLHVALRHLLGRDVSFLNKSLVFRKQSVTFEVVFAPMCRKDFIGSPLTISSNLKLPSRYEIF